MDKIERDQFMKNIHYWSEEIKKNPVDLTTLKPGDCIISNRGLCFEVIKPNKKTIKVKCLFLKSKNITQNRYSKISKNDSYEYGYKYYLVSRQFLVWLWMYQSIAREEAKQEAIKLSEEFTQLENDQLDHLVEKYNLTKDCDCITHEGPHFIHMQRYEISVSAKHMASLSMLSNSAFSHNEYTRLGDLARYMESLERVKNDVQPLHKGDQNE